MIKCALFYKCVRADEERQYVVMKILHVAGEYPQPKNTSERSWTCHFVGPIFHYKRSLKECTIFSARAVTACQYKHWIIIISVRKTLLPGRIGFVTSDPWRESYLWNCSRTYNAAVNWIRSYASTECTFLFDELDTKFWFKAQKPC